MRTFSIIILFIFLIPSDLMSQDTLTSDVIFLYYFKTKNKGIKKKDLTPFLERYYKEEFEQKSMNKSTKNQYIEEKLEYYNTQLETTKYYTEYITTTYVTLKEYDIAKQAFNLEMEHYFTRGTINPADRWSGKLDYVGRATNFEKYQNLKMECNEIIDLFINPDPALSKKNIPVTISLSFYGGVNDEANQFGSTVLFIGYVLCNINKLTFHFSDTVEYVYVK